MELTPRVEAWRDGGAFEEVEGRRVFVRCWGEEREGMPLVLLHGFPSSSYDFRHVAPQLESGPVLAFDFPGFGLSDKPRGAGYGLGGQADVAEAIALRRFGDRGLYVVAHDMGTSVATELMARDLDGTARLTVAGATLFNGSIVLERASLTPSQKLLRSRIGPLAARLSSKRFFRQQFGSVFSTEHPLSDDEADDQWALICHNGGRTMGHELVAYLDERVRLAPRWHGAIGDWRGELGLIWGMLDPVATTDVFEAVRELRPAAPAEELPGLGHYPQLEDPDRVARALAGQIARVGA